MAQKSCQVELRDQLATRQDLRSALGWGSTKDIVGDGDNRDMGKVVSIFTDTNINIYFFYLFNKPCNTYFLGALVCFSLVSHCRQCLNFGGATCALVQGGFNMTLKNLM